MLLPPGRHRPLGLRGIRSFLGTVMCQQSNLNSKTIPHAAIMPAGYGSEVFRKGALRATPRSARNKTKRRSSRGCYAFTCEPCEAKLRAFG